MIIVKFISVILISYLLGSIPFGLIISRYKANVDVRQFGSGKTGATNVLRTLGLKWAAIVAVLDVLKGVGAVMIAGLIFRHEDLLMIGNLAVGTLVVQTIAALIAMAGHNWPIFYKFKGGRGVATYFGGLAALYPPAALFGGEILVVSAGLTRYVSLGSIAGAIGAAAILVPLTIYHGFSLAYLGYAIAGGVIVLVMHRDNIVRLINGKERRLGEKTQNLTVSSEK